MRQVCTIVAVLVGVGLGLGVSSHEAKAGPLPAVSAPVVAQTVIENAGYWKRRWRYGYRPDVILPDAGVDVDVDVVAPDLTPPIIAIVPVRPVSCGEYRYWDGDRCVDARYNKPYLGPR